MLCFTSPTINTLGFPQRSREMLVISVSCTLLLSWYSSTRISSNWRASSSATAVGRRLTGRKGTRREGAAAGSLVCAASASGSPASDTSAPGSPASDTSVPGSPPSAVSAPGSSASAVSAPGSSASAVSAPGSPASDTSAPVSSASVSSDPVSSSPGTGSISTSSAKCSRSLKSSTFRSRFFSR